VAKWRQKLSRNTAIGYRYELCRFLDYDYLTHHGGPTFKVPLMGPQHQRPNTATDEQIRKLLSAAPAHLKLFILLCWQCALRFSEAMSITPRFYDIDRKCFSVVVKGDKRRNLPAPPEVAAMIESTLQGDPDDSCIAILRGRHTLKGPAMRIAWRRLCQRCEVHDINPHDLRRTTATRLYEATKDIRAVQDYLGHSALVSTLRYLAPLKEEQLREFHNILKFELPRRRETA